MNEKLRYKCRVLLQKMFCVYQYPSFVEYSCTRVCVVGKWYSCLCRQILSIRRWPWETNRKQHCISHCTAKHVHTVVTAFFAIRCRRNKKNSKHTKRKRMQILWSLVYIVHLGVLCTPWCSLYTLVYKVHQGVHRTPWCTPLLYHSTVHRWPTSRDLRDVESP